MKSEPTGPPMTSPVPSSQTALPTAPPPNKKAKHTHPPRIRATYPSHHPKGPKRLDQLPRSDLLWGHVATLTHFTAQREVNKLNQQCALGIGDTNPDGMVLAPDNKYQRKMLQKIIAEKWKHPNCIVFVRSGNFFTAYGIDAVICMEYITLNPKNSMSSSCIVGGPLKQIQTYLNQLLHRGLSSVVCDDDDIQLINHQNPIYFGAHLSAENVTIIPPHIAIYLKHDCLDMYIVNQFEKKIILYRNVHVMTLPLLVGLHWSSSLNTIHLLGSTDTLSFTKLKTRKLSWSCNSDTFLNNFIQNELKESNQDLYDIFEHNEVLQRCTMEQLGICMNDTGNARGVPRLLRSVCPNAPIPCQKLVAQLLICPPSFEVCELFRNCVRAYANPSFHSYEPLPLPLSLPPPLHTLLLYLRREAASAKMLRTLALHFLFASKLLSHSINNEIDIHELVSKLHNYNELKKVTLTQLNEQASKITLFLGDAPETISHPTKAFDSSNTITQQSRRNLGHQLEDEMIESEESWHGNVSQTQMRNHNLIVSNNRREYLNQTMGVAFQFAKSNQWKKIGWSPKIKSVISKYKLGPDSRKAQDFGVELKGKHKGYFTIPGTGIKRSLNKYLDSCIKARAHAEHIRKELNKMISESLISYTHSFWTLNRTVHTHVEQALQQRWCHATISNDDNASLQIKKLRPFWMSDGVPNDISLNRIAILTGCNMGGKSTLSRSLAAAAILGKAGFMVPADSATFSPGLCVFLNAGNADCALNDLSGYGAECVDMIALEKMAIKSPTLAICDEIASGTSDREGTGMALAYLQRFGELGVIGLFSTHFDRVLTDKSVVDVPKFQMKRENGHFTFVMSEGVCKFRHATNIARTLGMSEEICGPADKFIADIDGDMEIFDKIAMSAIDCMSRYIGKKYDFIWKRGEQSPAVAKSCVYLLESSEAWYVGETDNIGMRIKNHTKKKNQDCMYVWFVHNKSMAKKIETEVGRRLQKRGFTMMSVNDNHHTHFGGF
jgi:predicted GIY-YIG superfamily endonuclease